MEGKLTDSLLHDVQRPAHYQALRDGQEPLPIGAPGVRKRKLLSRVFHKAHTKKLHLLGKTINIDSFDFGDFESHVHEAAIRRRSQRDNTRQAAFRWLFNFIIGCTTALIAVLITYSTRELTKWKFDTVNHIIGKEIDMALPRGSALPVFLAISSMFVLLATLPVAFIEPVAAGSGISEIKCILNGVKIPRVVRFKTLLCKVFGVCFSVSGGLPVGKEGPMIHSGAIVAAGLSQGKSTTLGFDTRFSKFQDFRNDREKRDFIACGAAAGVAAAFGAPIGGLLFTLEEGASFWSQSLTWRTFFCAMISTYVLDVFLSGINDDSKWGQLSTPGMLSFGDYNITGQTRASWRVYEIPFFIALGVIGGLAGAVFNSANMRLTRFRSRHVNTPIRKVIEVVAICLTVAIVAFMAPVMFGHCETRPPKNKESLYTEDLVQFYCGPDQYNMLASLFLSPSEVVIRQLFHFTSTHISSVGLLFFFFFYGSLTCVTYGSAVPSGLFIPSLLTGSALGRYVGQLLTTWFPNHVVDPGTYSLIGAAAMLGGMARMTISLAVILLESTGDYQYGLPLMATLMLARWTGNVFNEGLYDLHIHFKHWPLLEGHPKKVIAAALTVGDVMTPDPIAFREVEKVGHVVDVLLGSPHNGFPVLRTEPTMRKNPRLGTLAGLAYRRHICVLLHLKAFTRDPPDYMHPTSSNGAGADSRPNVHPNAAGLVSWESLEKWYPRYPLPELIDIQPEDRECWLDLRPYLNPTPHTVNVAAPVTHAFRLYRTIGLRHLLVVDDFGDCVGVLTRSELTEEALKTAYEAVVVNGELPPQPPLEPGFAWVNECRPDVFQPSDGVSSDSLSSSLTPVPLSPPSTARFDFSRVRTSRLSYRPRCIVADSPPEESTVFEPHLPRSAPEPPL